MDVFQRHRPGEVAGLYALQDALQARADVVAFLFREDPLARQHAGVRDRALDIVRCESLVELD